MQGQEKESEALERIIVDASAEPIVLSYTFLKSITKNFSEDREIGIGGFGVVYMGIIRNMKVAIKKLSRIDEFSEKQFEDELKCLKRVKHKNIVRFLGYCSDTPTEVVEYKGTFVVAEHRRRFLCFEYVPNKSLDEYIKDESRERGWDTSYDLIQGVCQGLHYLHNKERINHLDLKPANILLDADMIPKITDFGLSRRFSGERSRIITEHIHGTLGYIAPEYLNKGEISFKTDIYSLGVIIMKLLIRRNDDLCGLEGLHEPPDECPRTKRCIKIAKLCVDPDQQRRPTIDNIIDMLNVKETLKANAVSSLEQGSNYVSLDEVHPMSVSEETSQQQLPDDGKVQPVSIFAEPSQVQRIISSPNGSKSTRSAEGHTGNWLSKYGRLFWAAMKKMVDPPPPPPIPRSWLRPLCAHGSCKTSNLLDIHPRELHFYFKPNEVIRCPVSLTNKTDHYVGVWITASSPEEDLYNPLECSLIQPHSTWVVAVEMKKQQQPPQRDTEEFEVLMIAMGSEDDIRSLKSSFGSSNDQLSVSSYFWTRVEELGGEIHVAVLKAVICDPGSRKASGTRKTIPTGELGCIFSMDVHPINTWIITGHEGGFVSVWNYQTQEREMALKVVKEAPYPVYSAKFITRQKWFVIGDGHGRVRVYNYTRTRNNAIKQIRAHGGKPVTSLAVHSTKPFLLTSSQDDKIKLWDWKQGWSWACTFDGYTGGVGSLTFSPWDIDSFASVRYNGGEAKVLNIDSSKPRTSNTVVGPVRVDYLHTDSARDLLVAASCDQCAYIWDLQRREFIHKLGGHGLTVCDVASHPTLPVLATSSRDGTVCLWDTDTYRLEKFLQLPLLGEFVNFALTGTEGRTRILVGCTGGISIMEINLLPSCSVSKLSGEVQSTVVSALPLSSTSSPEIDFHEKASNVTNIQPLEFCFPFRPNNGLQYPVTLTNMTDNYVGVWVAPVGANMWMNEFLEYPCSFFFMKPNSTCVATTVTTKKKQQLSARDDTCKFEMKMIVVGSEHDYLNLESPTGSDLLKLVEESGGKLPQAMSTAIYSPAKRKIVTIHQVIPSRKFGRVFTMDVHLSDPWILMGHERGFVSIWNYQTQQTMKAFKVSTCVVCSVKFIGRNERMIAVAAGDDDGFVHVIKNCFEVNKVETFEAHPKRSVNSLAVHPTYPMLLSSSCDDGSKIKLWSWNQDGWECTRIFQGHTNGVRHLAFNQRDINTFASVGTDGDAKVWNLNSSNDITPSSLKPEKVDYFFTDRHRHFLISCGIDQIDNAYIWDLQTKDHLQTLGVFMRSNLHKNNDVGVGGHDGGNNTKNTSGRGNEIPGKQGNVKNNGNKNPGDKQNHGGGGDYANNGSGPTSVSMGHSNTAARFYPQNYNIFSDDNPNGCSVM
ncbi:unnamed protein product [Urochloa humidicola]